VESVAALARLEPQVVAPGHGAPMSTGATAMALRVFSDSLSARQSKSKSAKKHRGAKGFLRPVGYRSRASYRRPPDMYLRFQWLGPLLTTMGVSPGYVVTLEVPGRCTGVIRRTTLVQASYGPDP
jgi:hypothetical protein